MNTINLKKQELQNQSGEEGAAMVMVLMISFLLLVASAGLMLEVSMNSQNVTDATSEQQAYNASESGIQSALNVLRGNVQSVPLLDGSKPASDAANVITFRRALTLGTSNDPNDGGGTSRLSRWINYNYSPSGATVGDRVTVGSGTYDPYSGYAYSLEITDPDNTGSIVSYNTSAKIDGGGSTKVVGSDSNTAVISYVPVTKTNLDVSSGSVATDFGQFNIVVNGSGGSIPADGYRFEITVNMTDPFTATRVIRGTIESGNISSGSTGTVKFEFDSQKYALMGSTITLTNDPMNPNTMVGGTSQTTISGTMTQVEPTRVLVKSTGYGPRGSKKVLEAIVRKNFFDGLGAPATLMLVGSTSGFAFAPGTSNRVVYSGDDVASDFSIPSIGTTSSTNLNSITASLTHPVKTDPQPPPANVDTEMPPWLQSAENLDDLLQALKNVAQSSGSYYASGVTPPSVGNNANASGLTYADGDLELNGSGGGILVVTGDLTLRGGFDFNGLIIVTGSGGVTRSGGGNGILQGNVVIAPYDPTDLVAGFTGPKYGISGGGKSNVKYNSSSLANGLTAVSNFVLGVADK